MGEIPFFQNFVGSGIGCLKAVPLCRSTVPVRLGNIFVCRMRRNL